jgi:hypothetical protein
VKEVVMSEAPKTKNGKPVIVLPEDLHGALIIKAPTGVIYTAQVGGTRCMHPEEEGFLVPLLGFDYSVLAAQTLDYFEAPNGDSYRSFPEGAWLKAAFSVMTGFGEPLELELDREEPTWGEAWVPIKCTYGRGWLTWPNSD